MDYGRLILWRCPQVPNSGDGDGIRIGTQKKALVRRRRRRHRRCRWSGGGGCGDDRRAVYWSGRGRGAGCGAFGGRWWSNDDGKDHGKKDDGKDRGDDRRKDDDVKKVGCDPDELIAALVRANAKGGAKLELEPKCTYTLTAFDEKDDEVSGLPEIVERVKIDGNGAKIVRAANAEAFRIFNVGVGGDLTLRDLTLKGGDARESEVGGGALLVQEGGRATIEDSKLTLNRSDSFGGAITNLGITRISGEDKSEKDGDKNDDSKKDDYGKDDYGKDGDKKDDDHHEDGATELTNNSAVEDGGAILNAGALTVENARLSRNNAENGGALANVAGVAKVTRSELDHNQALELGGAISAEGFGTITQVKESYVQDNTADDAGAIFNDDAQMFLQRTKIRGNTAAAFGGGIINAGTLTVEKSKINENKALTGVGGGLINIDEAVLRDSEVNKNTAFGEDAFGGGIVNAGDLRLTDTDVIENASTEPPGGVANLSDADITVDDDSKIIKNRPTNCAGPEGSDDFSEVPNCFG